MLINPAYAQAASGGGDLFGAFLPIILIFVIFYFLLIRPQQKKQKEHKNKVAAIKKGDNVLLAGGFYGQVTHVEEHNCKVEIAKGVEVTVLKQTVADVIDKEQMPKLSGTADKGKSQSASKATRTKATSKKTAKATKEATEAPKKAD